ncbi:hypothetical protein PPL_08509 [Heterostelium album PN500]|uniref:Uncharacterized protein n=1 Tax=Heterostelium pallidum (strain ATCC 26659 / Pp 5 / PN500) TaxID=670386 RepID=D3BID9_HETP5|nr:hypothetical protein PPL_08509 [Heterostelium album PN500]EFA79039.1 hypothetical protein PPL_08509 [Heterostelium album PN500]|eukprot:XP_020431162.1 hypothetical protein PPL_08509 [Heterostelium album PN500]
MDMDVPLLVGYLPPKLEKLKFEWKSFFNEPILAGVLPITLKKLKFGERFNQLLSCITIIINIFRVWNRLHSNTSSWITSSNLRALVHYGKSMISDGVLPSSLCTLRVSPLSWIPFIKSLNNLTTLILIKTDDLESTLDLADLPGPLTNLDININMISMRYSKIGHNIISKDYVTINFIDSEFPNTVEEIVIEDCFGSDKFSSKLIPNSVKSMTIPSNMIENVFDQPKSVTNFCFINYNYIVDLNVRKIYDNHYLIFGQSQDKFNAAIVSRILSHSIYK